MQGLLFALGAYVIWGCFPLFFSLLDQVPATEVLANRIVYACIVSLLLLAVTGTFKKALAALRQRRNRLPSLMASITITTNWFVFIWAVGEQRVVEASLGYFITPLVSLLLGALLLKEPINIWQKLAGWIAAVAIAYECWQLGSLPWVSLSIAITFGLYGLVRKQQSVDSLTGLTLETLWTFPLALAYLAWQYSHFDATEVYTTQTWTLLALSGLVTAIPLLMFASAVRSLNLNVAGFIMYINPLLQFVWAVTLLDETVQPSRYVTIVTTLVAMAIFTYGLMHSRRRKPLPVPEA